MNVNRETVKIYWRHAWRYPVRATIALVSMPLAILGNQFLPPLIAADILQRLSTGNYNPNDLWGSFGGELALYAGIAYLGGVILWRVVSYFVWTVEMRVVRDLYRYVFNHLTQLDANFHANHFGGSLVSQTNKFARNSYVAIQDGIMFEVGPLLVVIAFSAIFLYPRAPLYVVALVGFSALFMIVAWLVAKRIRKYNEAEAEVGNSITARLADTITNIAAVKSFAASTYENKVFAGTTEKWRKAENSVMRVSLVRASISATITVSLGSVALLIAVYSVAVLKADLSTVFLVVSYTQGVGMALWEFSQQAIRNFNRSFGDARAMTEILLQQPAVRDPSAPKKSVISRGAIAFNHISFVHADAKVGDSLFSDLSLNIPAGKKIGLVGHSGSGKTTLTRLLLRFSDIDGGSITIDGQDISQISQDDLRRSIAYVPQEPLLFHRTLRENIAYGRPNATEDEIREAARKAHAAEFIDKLPNGYDTEVGERGVKLSGGQRQRIAIARAILKDAPILVLDEATSALDSESERLIQSALWELMKGRTAIVIAHRLSTIQRMDTIVVLDNGKILEQGSHAELLAKKGTYAELWAHQSGGFIEEA